MALLDACYLKLERSLEHLNALNQARDRAFKAETQIDFTVRGELNSQGNRLLIIVDEVQDLPTVEWGIVIGDAVHCLRSALDQMVYGLATDPTRFCAFPICDTAKEWAIEAPAMVYSVPEEVVALIDRMQPYHRGDAAGDHPLALLRKLSNLDKHRTIPTTALTPMTAEADITPKQGIEWHSDIRLKGGRPLEPDAVIAEIDIRRDDSGLEPQMNVVCGFGFDVAFGKAPTPSALRHKPVVITFNELLGSAVLSAIGHIAKIVEPDVARPDRLEYTVD